MMTQTAEEVALNFMRYIVLQYGIPSSVVTDQGTQFMGNVFKRSCKLLRIHKLNTSAYHPESNGALERAHKTMREYLRCFCYPKGTHSHKWLPFACFVYNTTPHTLTKFTPYEILFGRKANVPGQLQQTPTPIYNYDDLIHDVKGKLRSCHEIARANLKRSKQHRIAQQSFKVNLPNLHTGDKVQLRNEKGNKLDPLWLGPYTIVAIDDNKTNVELALTPHRRVKVHVNRLKKYRS